MSWSVSLLQPLHVSVTHAHVRAHALFSAISSENFAGSEYHQLAVRQLKACPVAMESLGAPPLRVHNIHLTDRYNRVDHQAAQVQSVRGCPATV